MKRTFLVQLSDTEVVRIETLPNDINGNLRFKGEFYTITPLYLGIRHEPQTAIVKGFFNTYEEIAQAVKNKALKK